MKEALDAIGTAHPALKWLSAPLSVALLSAAWARRERLKAWCLARWQNRTGARLERLTELVERVVKEVTPNGGGSLKDAVVRNEAKTDALAARVEALSVNLRATNELSDRPWFVLDGAGELTDCNDAYLDLVGLAKPDVLGLGWTSALDTREMGLMLEKWHQALRSRSTQRHSDRFGVLNRRGGRRHEVESEVLIFRDGTGGVTYCFGTTRVLRTEALPSAGAAGNWG